MAKEEVKKEAKKVATKKTSAKKDAVTKVSKKASSVTKKVTEKKAVDKKTKSTPKKVASETEKKTAKKLATKSAPKKVASKEEKKVTKKPAAKSTSKTASAKKVASTKSKTASASKKSSTASSKTSPKKKALNSASKNTVKPMLTEYYDLPYRYNQTIVKILAQTPTTLFVYWDVSDEDRKALTSMHGDNFFSETKPVLIVHNITHNDSFEIEINDFANSWYIRTQEPNCNYVIELGRKFISNQGEYIYIDSSNKMVSPNDHVLFENANLGNVLFKNVKTNQLSTKDFGSLKFIRDIDKLYGNIYDVYSAIYDSDIFNELTGPSSGEFYLKK